MHIIIKAVHFFMLTPLSYDTHVGCVKVTSAKGEYARFRMPAEPRGRLRMNFVSAVLLPEGRASICFSVLPYKKVISPLLHFFKHMFVHLREMFFEKTYACLARTAGMRDLIYDAG